VLNSTKGCKVCIDEGLKYQQLLFRILGLIKSGPSALLVSRLFKTSLTSSAVKGAAPRFSSEDKESLLSKILRSCRN
jgi:hypothetical protein